MKNKKSNDLLNNSDVSKNFQIPFQDIFETEELFFKIIEFFPYPIQVHSPDGVSVMINKSMLDEFEVPSKDLIIGKYNILEDPTIIELGLIKSVKQAFNGETIYLADLKVPLKSIRKCYDSNVHDIDAMYQDATLYPILDDNDNVLYVVVILITRRIYRGKESIIKAKEYFKNNWLKEFSINEVAKAVNLSPYHFSRIFKKDVGITPYKYYLNIKIEKIKEMLCDTNLSISEVFTTCGVDYHGNYAKLFKNNVGVTPTEYRKKIENSNRQAKPL